MHLPSHALELNYDIALSDSKAQVAAYVAMFGIEVPLTDTLIAIEVGGWKCEMVRVLSGTGACASGLR